MGGSFERLTASGKPTHYLRHSKESLSPLWAALCFVPRALCARWNVASPAHGCFWSPVKTGRGSPVRILVRALFSKFRLPSARWGPWPQRPEASPWIPTYVGIDGKGGKEGATTRTLFARPTGRRALARPAGAATRREAYHASHEPAKRRPIVTPDLIRGNGGQI